MSDWSEMTGNLLNDYLLSLIFPFATPNNNFVLYWSSDSKVSSPV